MIGVVIVNWNSGKHLNACLDSLLGDSGLEIVVVDNASTDGSAILYPKHSRVSLVRSEENLGFGKACNLGAMRTHGEFLLFLNPDALVFPGTLSKVIDYMQDPLNAGVGICGVQLIDEFGCVARTCARFPSPLGFLSHSLGLDRVFPRAGHTMVEWHHEEIRAVDQVIGAFFFVRRELFNALGGFDERFFLYFEEVDFSLRASQAGWQSVYLADAQAFHAGGGSSHQVKARRLFYSLRSRLQYSAKHFGALGIAIVLVGTLLAEPMSRSALAIARLSPSALKETWQGYAMLWAWLPIWFLRSVRP